MHVYSSDADEDYSEDSYSSSRSSSGGREHRHQHHHQFEGNNSRLPPNHDEGARHPHQAHHQGTALPPFGADVSMIYQEAEDSNNNSNTNDDDDDDDGVHDEDDELLDMAGGGAGVAEVVGEDYEPTDQEIQEYCEWLNMDPVAERSLIWIAREALKAPLPENWKMCYTDDREIYYFNMRTGESIWDHPMDAFYKSLYREEKAKLDRKRKSMRLFTGSVETKAMSEFFSEVSETCGSGSDAFSDVLSATTAASAASSTPPPPWKIVPENLIDPIDMRIFVDPVVLPTSGRTVSRHTIINNKWRDPFSREYIENRRLVPNVDKRGEIDRWLQAMVEKYFEMINSPSVCETVGAGFKRLLILFPFMLDKDEEVSVRAQNFMQKWFEKQLLLATQQQQQQTTSSATASPSVTPRGTGEEGSITSGVGVTRKLSTSTMKKETASKQSTVNKRLQLSIAAGRNGPSSSSGAVASGGASTKSAIPPPPPTLIEVIESSSADERDLLIRCLLTMSSSASRETLLALVTAIPSLLLEPAFCKFSEDVLYVLRVSWKDLWEIANFINSREQAEQAAQQQQQHSRKDAPNDAEGGPSGGTFSSAPSIVNSTSVLDGSTTAGGIDKGGAGSSGGPCPISDPWASRPLSELYGCHVITDSERLLSLRWANVLALAAYESETSSLNLLAARRKNSVASSSLASSSSSINTRGVILTHPIAMMDLVGGIHIALAMHASPKVTPKNPSALNYLLARCDGWPLKLSGCSDKHIRCLLELAVMDQIPKQQVTSLFELCLQGSERCLDVIGRCAMQIKKNLIELSRPVVTSGGIEHDDGNSTNQIAFTNVDLMAAVMVFHEMATLAEFAQACPPTLALKIGYNLTPRLTRSQWRPRHFHATVTTLQQLVDQHPAEAWVVMDRVGLTFFLKELTKKRSQVSDIRAKLETLEQAEKALEVSNTHNRWALLAVKLLIKRRVEVDECIRVQREKKSGSKQPKGRDSLPTCAPSVGKLPAGGLPATPAATVSATVATLPKLPSIRGAASATTAPAPSSTTETASVSQPEGLGKSTGGIVTPIEGTLPPAACSVRANLQSLDEQLARIRARGSEIVKQRSELLSQTLQLLITVRLKPKQRPPAEAQTTQQRKKAPGGQTPRGSNSQLVDGLPPPPPPLPRTGATPRSSLFGESTVSLPAIS